MTNNLSLPLSIHSYHGSSKQIRRKARSFVSHSNKINETNKKTRVLQLLKVREACGGCWATKKSKDKSEKSKEKDCRRQKWAKHEDGGFIWKNQGATKLCQWETNQVGESGGRRVTHVPPMHRRFGNSYRRRTHV